MDTIFNTTCESCHITTFMIICDYYRRQNKKQNIDTI